MSWPRPAGSPCGHTSPGRFLPLPAVGGTAQHRTGLATVIRPAPAVGTPRSRDEFRVPAPSKDATDQLERRAPWRIL